MKKIAFLALLSLISGLIVFFNFVNQTQAGTCALKSAIWDNSRVSTTDPSRLERQAGDGDAVGIVINADYASECPGQKIDIEVWRNDTMSGDNKVTSDTKTFDSAGRLVKSSWTVRPEDHSSIYVKYFYIVARLSNLSGAGTRIKSQTASENGGVASWLYVDSSGSSPNGASIKFDFSPKSIQTPTNQTTINFSLRMIVQPGAPATSFKTYCASYGQPRWTVQTARSVDDDQSGFINSGNFTIPQNDYTFDFSKNIDFRIYARNAADQNNFTVPFAGRIWCGSKKVLESKIDFKVGTGGAGPGPGTCNNNGVCDAGETSATCKDCPVKPGETQVFKFELKNPIEAKNFVELIDVIATWLFNIAIPIAVAMIVYAGVIFLISRGDTTKVAQAKKILLYAVVGLAIILIGKGFITLIESVLNLGVAP